MQFYFLSDHSGRKIASDWLTCPSARTENNIHEPKPKAHAPLFYFVVVVVVWSNFNKLKTPHQLTAYASSVRCFAKVVSLLK